MAQSGPLIHRNVPFVPSTGPHPGRLVIPLKASLWYILAIPWHPSRGSCGLHPSCMTFFPLYFCRSLVYLRGNAIAVSLSVHAPFCCSHRARKVYATEIPKPSSLGFSSIDTLIFVARYVYRTWLQNYRPSSYYYYSTVWESKLRETEHIARHPVLFERSIAPSPLRSEPPATLHANFLHRVDRVL